MWAQKTLQDSGAGQVNSTPKPTTLVDLGTLAAKEQGTPVARSSGFESQVWELSVSLVEAKLEADGDIHLVVQDGATTANVEFPDSSCVTGANQNAQNAMNSARSALEHACPGISVGGFTHLSGNAVVAGVGFFDRPHGQTGGDTLSNGANLELHPVVAFSTSGCVSSNGSSGAAVVPGGAPVAAQVAGTD